MRAKKTQSRLATSSYKVLSGSHLRITAHACTRDVRTIGKRIVSENRELLDKLKKY